MPVTSPFAVNLTGADLEVVEVRTRPATASQRDVLWARIVLAVDVGDANAQIGRDLHRYNAEGMDGERDRPRPDETRF